MVWVNSCWTSWLCLILLISSCKSYNCNMVVCSDVVAAAVAATGVVVKYLVVIVISSVLRLVRLFLFL